MKLVLTLVSHTVFLLPGAKDNRNKLITLAQQSFAHITWCDDRDCDIQQQPNLKMWIILLCITLLLWIYFKGVKPFHYWREKEVPCTTPWPFLGDLALTLFGKRALAYIYEDIYKSHPRSRYIGFYNMATPALMIRDPDLIKKITVKEFDSFPQHKPFLPEDADPLWSKNLLAMSGGENWHNMRTTLSPAFTSSKIKIMFHLMKECATQFSSHFLKHGGTVTVEMKDAISRLANDIIATTAFGISCDSLKQPENEFYLMGKEMTSFTAIRSLLVALHNLSPRITKFLNMPMFSDKIRGFYGGLIKDTVKTREAQQIIRPDMIHLLMEARKGRLKDDEPNSDAAESGFAVVRDSEIIKLQKGRKVEITDDDITAQAVVFFFGGFDTVSIMLCHASYELALNPDIQQKLRQEVDTALEDCKGEITYEVVMGMKYLNMVIAETLRKWPPFVSTDRQSVRPFIIEAEEPGEKPLHLPTGSSCVIPIYAIHRDANHYPDPEKFDPDRFSEENKHKIKPFTYLPFGAGPRNCIASRFALLEGKIVMTEIIRKFEIVPVEKTKVKIEIMKRSFTTTAEGGFWLGLKPRNLTL